MTPGSRIQCDPYKASILTVITEQPGIVRKVVTVGGIKHVYQGTIAYGAGSWGTIEPRAPDDTPACPELTAG